MIVCYLGLEKAHRGLVVESVKSLREYERRHGRAENRKKVVLELNGGRWQFVALRKFIDKIGLHYRKIKE